MYVLCNYIYYSAEPIIFKFDEMIIWIAKKKRAALKEES
jgi:hypothetical protein